MVSRDIEFIVVGVFKNQILFGVAVVAHLGGAGKAGNAVVNVNHIAAGGEVGEDKVIAEGIAGSGGPVAAFLDRAKEFGVGKQGQGSR